MNAANLIIGNPFKVKRDGVLSKEFEGNKNSLGANHDNGAINETVYFFQEDLYPVPFSSDKLPEILNRFSLEAGSREANAMKETIKGCEREVMTGQEMYCATSFESFVDSSISKLGKNIELLSNELGKEKKNPVFTIDREIQNMGEEELVCHKMKYPYAVFVCHSIDRTAVYKVPLVSIDGTKANALAICHEDTSAWNPDHPAFWILKVKPGTVPICQFIVRDTLVWVSK
ncbi:PREDICTED: BURP domain protein RD22 [Theobroma cacao]|uniref:BURP domain protein RD22 n=1 Tax=Theobroma cacao TaxID=3641 RepID=A0AB32WWF7_THECC|nr:PREDICTED: BURP domain protein RD22 [Theobroma cacao]